jgi:hypothetical protein
MMTFTDFFAKFSDSELDEMIADYEKFRNQGLIDGCFLRNAANEWVENIGINGGVGLIMKDLAMESYRTRYHQLREQMI